MGYLLFVYGGIVKYRHWGFDPMAEIEAETEISKWADNIDDRRVISSFLEWLDGKRWLVAEYPQGYHTPQPINLTHHMLLDRYFEVDNDKLESERREVLDEARALNKG